MLTDIWYPDIFQSPLSEAAVETSLADDSSSIGAKDEEDDDDDDDASDDRSDANNCGGDPEKLKAFNVSGNFELLSLSRQTVGHGPSATMIT